MPGKRALVVSLHAQAAHWYLPHAHAATIRLFEGVRDVLGPAACARSAGALGDLAVGRRSGEPVVQGAGTSMTSRTGRRRRRRFFQHAVNAVDAGRKRRPMVRRAPRMLASAERLLDLFDIGGDCREMSVLAVIWSPWPDRGRSTSSRVASLARSSSRRGLACRAFGQLADMPGDDVVDRRAGRSSADPPRAHAGGYHGLRQPRPDRRPAHRSRSGSANSEIVFQRLDSVERSRVSLSGGSGEPWIFSDRLPAPVRTPNGFRSASATGR